MNAMQNTRTMIATPASVRAARRSTLSWALVRGGLVLLAAALASKAFAQVDPFWWPVGSKSYATGSGYGNSCASDGTQRFVGAPFVPIGAISTAGVVEVLDSSLLSVQTLTAGDPESQDYFGFAAHSDGGALVVGAPQSGATSTGAGKAYVFERVGAGWAQAAKLTGITPMSRDSFGSAVAISGTRVFVGAMLDDAPGAINSGSVTIFQKSGANWTTVGEIRAATPVQSQFFGGAISASGDRIAISATGDTVGGLAAAGSVYIYERSGANWVQAARITAPTPAAGRGFGSALHLAGDELFVSSVSESASGVANAGACYGFTRIGGVWQYTALITSPLPQAYDFFGISIARSGERLAIGEIGNASSQGQGRVRIFERVNGAWIPVSSHIDLVHGGGQYGSALAFAGAESLLIGAPDENSGGRAHVLDLVDAVNIGNSEAAQGPFLQELVANASANDRIAIRSEAFDWNGIADLTAKPVRFVGWEPLVVGADLLVRVASGTQFEAHFPSNPASGLSIAGQLVAPQSGTVTFERLETIAGGQLVQDGATLLVNRSMSTSGGRAYLKGTIAAQSVETSATGQNRVAGDVDCFADYVNAGTTIIQRGVLYIYGSLTNTGVLTGEYDTGYVPPAAGDGYSIGGDYAVGAGASLLLPDAAWWLRVGGDLDIAIDDPARFAMTDATVELTGLSGRKTQHLEALSADFGPDLAGFAPTNFPIGALRLRAGSRTAVVDAHVNSPASEGGCEVVYVKELVVPAGATLVTSGCPVYVQSATIAGTVTNPEDIVVVPTAPPCPADINLDGRVDAADILVVLAFWNNPTGYPRSDVNADGLTDAADLTAVLLAWGVCG